MIAVSLTPRTTLPATRMSKRFGYFRVVPALLLFLAVFVHYFARVCANIVVLVMVSPTVKDGEDDPCANRSSSDRQVDFSRIEQEGSTFFDVFSILIPASTQKISVERSFAGPPTNRASSKRHSTTDTSSCK